MYVPSFKLISQNMLAKVQKKKIEMRTAEFMLTNTGRGIYTKYKGLNIIYEAMNVKNIFIYFCL